MWEGRMPWSAVRVEAQRLEFCRLAVSDSGMLFVELCRRSGGPDGAPGRDRYTFSLA